MRLKRMPYGAVTGLAVGLLVLVVTNLVGIGAHVVVAQDETTPTPAELTPTPTPTATPVPTALPSLQLQTFVELTPDGDLGGDGVINPGDTVNYRIRLVNGGDTPSGPVEVVVLYDATFISGVANISQGGIAAEEGQVVWSLEGLEAGDDISLSFDATLRGRFPPGRTQVTGAVVVRAGAVELARSTLPAIEAVGPNLRLVDVAVELITDVSENGRIDPGDTVRFTISYSNTGGGPSQEASIVAQYSEDLTRDIVGNPDNGEVADGQLTWLLGSVPADKELVKTVQFTVIFDDEFPSGITTYDLKVAIRGATATLDERVVNVPVFGPSLVVSPRAEFLADADGDELVDAGDLVKIVIPYENVGTESALNVILTGLYDPARLEVSLVEQSGLDNPEEGTVTWSLSALDAGKGDEVAFQARVLSLEPGLESLQIGVTVISDQTALTRRDLQIPVDAPMPTPEGGPTPTTPPQYSESRPAQGQGILSGPTLAVLIGLFLTFGLLSIVFVGSRVLPGTPEERDTDDIEERAAHRRLVRELVEGVVLVAILFSVMILGLQNTLDQDSVNSIIAGIVGYVAGRVASQK